MVDDVARQLMGASGSCSRTQAEELLQKLVGFQTEHLRLKSQA